MIIRITVINIFKFPLPVAFIEMYLVKENMSAAVCFMPIHKTYKAVVGKPHIVT